VIANLRGLNKTNNQPVTWGHAPRLSRILSLALKSVKPESRMASGFVVFFVVPSCCRPIKAAFLFHGSAS